MAINAKIYGFIFIFITLCGTVAGQICIKKGISLSVHDLSQEFQIFHVLLKGLTNQWVIVGLLLACIAACSWILTLSRLPLNYAYPFLSVTFPIVAILSSIILHEVVSFKTFVGLGLIMLGLIVASIGR